MKNFIVIVPSINLRKYAQVGYNVGVLNGITDFDDNTLVAPAKLNEKWFRLSCVSKSFSSTRKYYILFYFIDELLTF